MIEDHLDKETSVAITLTADGIEAKAKSRTFAALDRLGGNLLEWGNVFLEAGTSRRRAKIDGEAAIIAATAAEAVKLIGSDNEFTARAIASQFGAAARLQLNKDAVSEIAIEDLRDRPPTSEQATGGPEVLSEEFFTRFESYAGGASTDELRERWGRVLAGEIRNPGTFSRAVMRVVDEIDTETAALFERACQSRISSVLPIALTGKLAFDDIRRLVEAGLLVEPGLGHANFFKDVVMFDGRKIWLLSFGNTAIAFPRSKAVVHSDETPLTIVDARLGLKVYILTDVGAAISTILSDDTDSTIERLITVLKIAVPDVVTLRRRPPETSFYVTDGQIPPESPVPVE